MAPGICYLYLPKTTWPMTVPEEVATLKAVSALEGVLPGEWAAFCQKTTPSMEDTMLIANKSYASWPAVSTYAVWRWIDPARRTGKETNACDCNRTDMVPPKRSLVDLSESQAASLVGVSNVGVVIVDCPRSLAHQQRWAEIQLTVVESSVAASSPAIMLAVGRWRWNRNRLTFG